MHNVIRDNTYIYQLSVHEYVHIRSNYPFELATCSVREKVYYCFKTVWACDFISFIFLCFPTTMMQLLDPY